MENKNNNKDRKEEVKEKTESVLGTLSEDDLLASSQDTIVEPCTSRGARHSTPLLRPSRLQSAPGTTSGEVVKEAAGEVSMVVSGKAAKENAPVTTVKVTKKKNKKSSGALLKARYLRAKFILAKIAKNEQAGKAHERDIEDRAKCEAAIKEYEAATTAKLNQPQQPHQHPKSAQRSAKRNRSQDVSGREAKKSKHSSTQGVEGPSTSAAAAAARAAYSEVARDHLQVALVDAKTNSGREVLPLWCAIEGRLSGMVVRHLIANKGPAPLFDSGEICRGCRVIKCANQFSKEFLERSLATVSNAWEGLSLKLIPASEIPRRPRARVWLPKMKLDSSEIVQCLKLQNPEVPMDDWSVIRVEEPQQNSSVVLLLISNESLEALGKQQFKLRFGLRLAKVKVFPASVAPDDDLEEAEDKTEKLLDDLRLSETDADSEKKEQS